MKSKYFSSFPTLFGLCVVYCFAFDRPCKEKSVGTTCLFDEECYGTSTMCKNRKCECQLGFEPYDIGSSVRICRPAPENIGSECQRECNPPLLCRKNRCECWQGKYFNDTCIVECPEGQEVIGQGCKPVAHLNETCRSDTHCVDPFTGCLDGLCQCRKGTNEVNGTCVGFCPDGQPSRQSCRRLHSTDNEILSLPLQTDSCPAGYTCMTYGKPPTGHCCKLYCPYGTPVLDKSCHPGATEHKKCRRLTHFCHSVQSPGWRATVCCPRPCRNPTPYYINGQCWANAQFGDPCHFTEQCEGGRTMVCKGRRCLCKTGYSLHPNHPFPSCVKSCQASSSTSISPGSSSYDCLQSVGNRKPCLTNRQCPQFARCYYGQCSCDCGYSTGGLLRDRCNNPEDPFNLHPLLNRFETFFGGK